MIGIYKITNTINGKMYIGQSVDITRRWRQHKNSELDYPLYKAFKKYGIENFIFEILEECSITMLNERERYYIQLYDSCRCGYNQTLNASEYGHAIVFTQDSLDTLFQLLLTSTIQQQELAQQFNCSERLIRDINRGIYWHRDDITYPIREYWIGVDGKHYHCSVDGIRANLLCPICGAHKTADAKLCKSCADKQQYTVQRPSAIELANEIINSNFCAVGRKYGVSDNAIRKWCKAYNMPTKKNEIKEWLLRQ